MTLVKSYQTRVGYGKWREVSAGVAPTFLVKQLLQVKLLLVGVRRLVAHDRSREHFL